MPPLKKLMILKIKKLLILKELTKKIDQLIVIRD